MKPTSQHSNQDVDSFLSDLKQITNRDEFANRMKEYESYKHQKAVSHSHLDDLRLKQIQRNKQQQDGFLQQQVFPRPESGTTKVVLPDPRMQGGGVQSDFNNFQIRNNMMNNNNSSQKLLKENPFLDHHHSYNQNQMPPTYQGQNQHTLSQQSIGYPDLARPQFNFQPQTNNYKSAVTTQQQQQGQRRVNPHQMHMHPQLDIKNNNANMFQRDPSHSNLNLHIQKLGGIQDTLSQMNFALNEFEGRSYFSNTYDNNYQHNQQGNSNPSPRFNNQEQQFHRPVDYVQNRPSTANGPKVHFNSNPIAEQKSYGQLNRVHTSPLRNPMEPSTDPYAHYRPNSAQGFGYPPNFNDQNIALQQRNQNIMSQQQQQQVYAQGAGQYHSQKSAAFNALDKQLNQQQQLQYGQYASQKSPIHQHNVYEIQQQQQQQQQQRLGQYSIQQQNVSDMNSFEQKGGPIFLQRPGRF